MKRIDLDDVPPKLAALLTGVEAGEEVILVQNGAVLGRLTAAAPRPAAAPEPTPDGAPEEQAKEIFEHFRSAIEDDF